jgi:hypothetical protein
MMAESQRVTVIGSPKMAYTEMAKGTKELQRDTGKKWQFMRFSRRRLRHVGMTERNLIAVRWELNPTIMALRMTLQRKFHVLH